MWKDKLCKESITIMDGLLFANSSIRIYESVLDIYKKGEEYLLMPAKNFWLIVADNCCYRAMAELAKIYDESKQSLGLSHIMNQAEQAARSHPKLFSIIQKSRKEYDAVQNIVRKLKTLRDKGLFHTDKKYATDLNELTKEHGLSLKEIKSLIHTAENICNGFLIELSGTAKSVEIITRDDATSVLDDVRLATNARKHSKILHQLVTL